MRKSIKYSYTPSEDDWIEFIDGVLSVGTYSYYIDSSGSIDLSKGETLELYKTMKRYYEKDN